MRSTFRLPVAGLAIVTALTLPHVRSDPVAVYAIIDHVVLAPDAANPTSVQIWGTFSTTDRKPGDHYGAAMKGYLYYQLGNSYQDATRREWADLKSVEGKKDIVGFGNKYFTPGVGRVRCATETPALPDMYPAGTFGVSKMQATMNTGWPIAKGLLDAKAADAPCGKAK